MIQFQKPKKKQIKGYIIKGGRMKDLQLMHDAMQCSLDRDNDWDFAKDLSDVRKVLEWLEEFQSHHYDEIKFLKKMWDR